MFTRMCPCCQPRAFLFKMTALRRRSVLAANQGDRDSIFTTTRYETTTRRYMFGERSVNALTRPRTRHRQPPCALGGVYCRSIGDTAE